jgi:transposase-like protein
VWIPLGPVRISRPPESLGAQSQAPAYCAVGRKYGVSDNAVRKWARFYEREAERVRVET